MRASALDIQHRLQSAGETGKVAVVDAAVVELVGKDAEQPRPVPSGWVQGNGDLHQSLDDFDRGSIGGGSSLCSQARCRQVAEHHFGTGPRLPPTAGPAPER